MYLGCSEPAYKTFQYTYEVRGKGKKEQNKVTDERGRMQERKQGGRNRIRGKETTDEKDGAATSAFAETCLVSTIISL